MSVINKLGLGIVAFEGTEHIKNITYELRSQCDEIIVCLQKLSYHGDPINQKDIDEVNLLLEKRLIDDIIWFEPTDLHEDDPEHNGPRLIETDKRNFILDFLEKDKNCSHALIIDSDEFYDAYDFAVAKQAINEDPNNKVSYCQYINYYRDYQHVMLWPFLSYVPFISEIKYRFDFYKGNFGEPSDPTRRYLIDPNTEHFSIFNFNGIKMHHLSWIRINIEDKINSWSSKMKFEDYEKIVKSSLDRYYNYKEGQNAIILFNVPNYEVVVNKLPEQYIYPHYYLTDRI